MSDRYVTLVGAEQVQSAANRMVEAADSMRQASRNIDDIYDRHQRFMDDWLQRYQGLLEMHKEIINATKPS